MRHQLVEREAAVEELRLSKLQQRLKGYREAAEWEREGEQCFRADVEFDRYDGG